MNSNLIKPLILLAVIIVISVVTFTLVSNDRKIMAASSDTVDKKVLWQHYDRTGKNFNAKYLSLYEVSSEGLKIKLLAQPINTNTDYKIMPFEMDGKLHYYAMTATDSSGNESVLSNIVTIDFEAPNPPVLINIINP